MESNSTSENCLGIIYASILYQPKASLLHVYQILNESLEEISKTKAFKTLPKLNMISIISNLDQSKNYETSRYIAIMNWVKHDQETHGESFPDLFHLIDLNKLP